MLSPPRRRAGHKNDGSKPQFGFVALAFALFTTLAGSAPPESTAAVRSLLGAAARRGRADAQPPLDEDRRLKEDQFVAEMEKLKITADAGAGAGAGAGGRKWSSAMKRNPEIVQLIGELREAINETKAIVEREEQLVTVHNRTGKGEGGLQSDGEFDLPVARRSYPQPGESDEYVKEPAEMFAYLQRKTFSLMQDVFAEKHKEVLQNANETLEAFHEWDKRSRQFERGVLRVTVNPSSWTNDSILHNLGASFSQMQAETAEFQQRLMPFLNYSFDVVDATEKIFGTAEDESSVRDSLTAELAAELGPNYVDDLLKAAEKEAPQRNRSNLEEWFDGKLLGGLDQGYHLRIKDIMDMVRLREDWPPSAPLGGDVRNALDQMAFYVKQEAQSQEARNISLSKELKEAIHLFTRHIPDEPKSEKRASRYSTSLRKLEASFEKDIFSQGSFLKDIDMQDPSALNFGTKDSSDSKSDAEKEHDDAESEHHEKSDRRTNTDDDGEDLDEEAEDLKEIFDIPSRKPRIVAW